MAYDSEKAHKYYIKNKARIDKYNRQYRQNNHARSLELQRNWNKRNKEYIKDRNLKYRYGIDIAEYGALSNTQGGVCAICGAPETQIDRRNGMVRALTVDHCHKTKKVRGLLCHKHNKGIGLFSENIDYLLSAIEYIRKFS